MILKSNSQLFTILKRCTLNLKIGIEKEEKRGQKKLDDTTLILNKIVIKIKVLSVSKIKKKFHKNHFNRMTYNHKYKIST
jgi:hypothetical protein